MSRWPAAATGGVVAQSAAERLRPRLPRGDPGERPHPARRHGADASRNAPIWVANVGPPGRGGTKDAALEGQPLRV